MTAPSSQIRPATRADLPAIASLRRLVFRHTEHPTEDALARYLELVLFDNPWVDEELPSLAIESPQGEIVGFMGRIVRPYVQGGRVLRGAVATEVMVHPASRGRGLGTQLMRTYLGGGQDFTVADRANEGFRRVSEACGGEVAAWYSWYWTAPLRASRYGVAQLGWRGAVRATLPVTSAFDFLAARIVPGRFRRRPPSGRAEEIDPETIPGLVSGCVGSESVYPVYDADALRWLFTRLADRLGHAYARLDRCAVRMEPHGIVGWFIRADRLDGRSETVQMVAQPAFRDLVFSHLLYRAWRSGAVTVEGRNDPFFVSVVVQRRLGFTLAQPWVVFHSSDPRVAAAFRSGNVFLSRLDAEWWLAT